RDLESAYGVAGAASGNGTVAIIDAGAYPIISSDLNVYRRQYGLPVCNKATGCLTVRSYIGGPERQPATTRLGKEIEEFVGVETALDMDMASAACPACKLILLQLPPKDALLGGTRATHRSQQHFATAVQTAHRMGADAVSISYGYPTDTFAATGPPAQ